MFAGIYWGYDIGGCNGNVGCGFERGEFCEHICVSFQNDFWGGALPSLLLLL
jgi:hypothetical protein